MIYKVQSVKNNVEIGKLNFSSLEALLSTQYKNSRIFIIVDKNTQEKCLPILISKIEKLKEAEVVVLPLGEAHKSIESCYKIWETLTDLKIQRKDLIVNLGGGITTDLGGFVASTFKRGLDFINIPTTLLAMIDASVGGKTGVNLGSHKNQIGVFALPVLTLCDATFLNTLPKRELVSGKAEMLKHGLIASAPLFEKLEKDNLLIPSDAVLLESVQIKADIVDRDFTEQGERKKLNFGHTIGHSLEGLLLSKNIRVTHGECVAWGMLTESLLSYSFAGLKLEELERIKQVVRRDYKELPIYSTDFQGLMEYMHHDKKNTSAQINFTLLNAIGDSQINFMLEDEEVLKALAEVFQS